MWGGKKHLRNWTPCDSVRVRLRTYQSALCQRENGDKMIIYFSLSLSLCVFLGGCEDHRQNSAEPHQSTEGERRRRRQRFVATWQRERVGQRSFPWVIPRRSSRSFSSWAVLHNVIRCSQDGPQGFFNLWPPPAPSPLWISAGLWSEKLKILLPVPHSCLAVITNKSKGWGRIPDYWIQLLVLIKHSLSRAHTLPCTHTLHSSWEIWTTRWKRAVTFCHNHLTEKWTPAHFRVHFIQV